MPNAGRYPQALYPDMTAASAAAVWQYWQPFGVVPPQLPEGAGPYQASSGQSTGGGWERVGGPTAEAVPTPQPTTRPATTQPAGSQPPAPQRPTSRPAGPTTRPAGGTGDINAQSGPGGIPLGNLHMSQDPVKGRTYPTGEVAMAAQADRASKGGQALQGGGIPSTQPAPTTQPSAPPEPVPSRTTRILKDDTHGATQAQYQQYKRAGFVWIPNTGRPPKGIDPNRWGHWGKPSKGGR